MTATEPRLDDATLDDQISEVIQDAGLRRTDNAFFSTARTIEQVATEDALAVALQWHAMTKAFMFTTIASIGVKARECHRQAAPDRDMLGALQTAFSVIGDDFVNIAPQFQEVAPNGPAGIHYVWWADTIVEPLMAAVNADVTGRVAVLPEGVHALLANMDRLADHPLGAAIQLRLVEDIALDIAVAFRRLLAKVVIDGRTPFTQPHALDWVDSHIKAETVHAASVSDDETGMTALAVTSDEREALLTLLTEYATSWARALGEFARALERSRRLVVVDTAPAGVRL